MLLTINTSTTIYSTTTVAVTGTISFSIIITITDTITRTITITLTIAITTKDFWSTVEKILQYFFSFQFVATCFKYSCTARLMAVAAPGCIEH